MSETSKHQGAPTPPHILCFTCSEDVTGNVCFGIETARVMLITTHTPLNSLKKFFFKKSSSQGLPLRNQQVFGNLLLQTCCDIISLLHPGAQRRVASSQSLTVFLETAGKTHFPENTHPVDSSVTHSLHRQRGTSLRHRTV